MTDILSSTITLVFTAPPLRESARVRQPDTQLSYYFNTWSR